MSNKVDYAMNLYLEGIRDGYYVEAVNKYTGDRYTQHSTGVRDGKEGFIEFFGGFVERNPVRDIQIVRKLEDGKNVFLHAYQNINNGEAQWITTDFFDTDENEKIIEHWDVIAEYSESNLSNHSSIDGESELVDLDKTVENKELVNNLLKDIFMRNGDLSKLDQYVSKDKFIEHSTDGQDSFDNLSKVVCTLNRPLNYEEIVMVVGQGNFVATLSRVTFEVDEEVNEFAHVDIFRIEDGLVVEHWENSEPVPEENVNSGKF